MKHLFRRNFGCHQRGTELFRDSLEPGDIYCRDQMACLVPKNTLGRYTATACDVYGLQRIRAITTAPEELRPTEHLLVMYLVADAGPISVIGPTTRACIRHPICGTATGFYSEITDEQRMVAHN